MPEDGIICIGYRKCRTERGESRKAGWKGRQEGRKDEEKLRDATSGVVRLAEVLIEPWFRARCAEAADPFRFDLSDDEEEEKEADLEETEVRPLDLSEAFSDDVHGTSKSLNSLKQHKDFKKWLRSSNFTAAGLTVLERRLQTYKVILHSD